VVHQLKELVAQLELEVLAGKELIDRPVRGGYASDMLSCVMKGGGKDVLWVTLQFHLNVVAVAGLLEMAAIVITEGNRPEAETIARAEREGVVLLATPRTTFTLVGQLSGLGVNGA
jgi:serine kinase of HPr protein (carbohydrate metabolism regulator)